MTGGLTFGAAKSALARVADNGVCDDDVRVMSRTNEATAALLLEIIPTNGMMTVDVVADGNMLLLPKEMENAIEVEVLDDGRVRRGTDVRQGFFDVVNPFTYVDPAMAHDNPLVDHFLVPDPDDPTILRRKYEYPGLSNNATVRVTGAKRYLPITSDSDYLIIQNIWALKLMIMAIERMENGKLDQWKVMKDEAVAVLTAEVKKHQLDPRNSMKRKAAWEADLVNYAEGTCGHIRARLAFEIPGALNQGKSELTRLLEQAEMRLMDKGMWAHAIEEFTADVVDGVILFPARVKSILAVAGECGPMDLRSIFFKYQSNGPGMNGGGPMLSDEGEQFFKETGTTRRRFRLTGHDSQTAHQLTVAAKLRWTRKTPEEPMTVKNYEALRLMCNALIFEQASNMNEAMAFEGRAVNEMEKELRDYLGGIKHVVSRDRSEAYVGAEM